MSFLRTLSQFYVFVCCQFFVFLDFSFGFAISNPLRWQQTPTLLPSHPFLTNLKVQNPEPKNTFEDKTKSTFYKSKTNTENKLQERKQLSFRQKTNYSSRNSRFQNVIENHNSSMNSLNYPLGDIDSYSSRNENGSRNIWPVDVSGGTEDEDLEDGENVYTGLSILRRNRRSLQSMYDRSLRTSNRGHRRKRRHPVDNNKKGDKFRFGKTNERNRKVKMKAKQNRTAAKQGIRHNLATTKSNNNNNNNNNNSRSRHGNSFRSKNSTGKQKQNGRRFGNHSYQHSSRSGTACHICNMKRIDKELRLKKLKIQILKQIGMTEFPNVTAGQRISQVPVLRQLIDNMSMQRDEPQWKDLPGDYELSFPERMIIIAEKPQLRRRSFIARSADDICYFNIGDKLEHSVIKEANLWLYLKKTVKTIKRSIVKIRIWNATANTKRERPLRSIKLDVSNHGQWIKLKMSAIVKYWVKHSDFNYGLNITAIDPFGDNRIWTPAVPGHDEEYPVMDITFSRQKHGRQRRTTSYKCSAKEPLGRCCLYPLTVDFMKMKWGWVLHPQKFEANYCSGNCTIDMMDDSFPNTYIGFQSGVSVNDIPCCTSTNESVLQILYMNHKNKIIRTNLKDIIGLQSKNFIS
ncbi:differentiation factor 11 [Octopus vulgaris]|uniref:Differentiation factor 11 n=1 Tax=Octopus vulgaris TaxID=6645 RepID=A0AA36FPV7_OCTVU|nr:differentiation factor 11 [Octopus vulgaris]